MTALNVVTVDSVAELRTQAAHQALLIKSSAGVEIVKGCSAWVSFTGAGIVTIQDSFNVTAVTDNGTGDYTIAFLNTMNTADYSLSGTAQNADLSTTVLEVLQLPQVSPSGKLAESCQVNSAYFNSAVNRTLHDATYINASFIGGI